MAIARLQLARTTPTHALHIFRNSAEAVKHNVLRRFHSDSGQSGASTARQGPYGHQLNGPLDANARRTCPFASLSRSPLTWATEIIDMHTDFTCQGLHNK
jgi:hypothetical protein